MTGPRKTQTQVSSARRAAALANIKKAHAAQRAYPLCNATRRTDGGKCGNLGTGTGGRCRLHGGATPKGKDWHKVNLVNPGGSIDKLPKKQKELARRRAKQEARRAAMTPEERTRHEAWHATHAPGGEDKRSAARQIREVREMLARRASAPPAEPPEATAIREVIEALERQVAALKQPPKSGPEPEDVFS